MRNTHLSKIGRKAIVTGAAEGIGRAYATRLAEDGADIVIIDRLPADETEAAVIAAGRKAQSHRCDLTDQKAVLALCSALVDEGGCDILVNNAGIGSARPFETVDYARLRGIIALNLEAPFWLCKAFVPGMKMRGWGRIVNISSTTFVGPVPNFVDYVTSKGGVVGLTRGLASEVGECGITVNAIAPGLIQTPLTVDGREGHMAMPQEGFDFVRQLQSIPRSMLPEDLVGTLSFLTSDEASFITGQVFAVDCGTVCI